MTGNPAKSGGLSPNLAAALAYLGGFATGILFLAVEKHDRFVRFHAMQSTITFVAVLVAHLLLRSVPIIGPWFRVPFQMGVVALWAWLIYQAFQGHRYKLPYIGDFAEQQLK